MNKLTTIAFVVLSITFSAGQSLQPTQFPKTEKETLEEVVKFHKDYTLSISLENTNSNHPVLVIAMELKNKAHFISPFEEKEFSGKFHFDFGSYKDLAFDGDFTETPKAKTKILNPNYTNNKGAIWVTKNTIYKQPLNKINKDDFQVFGRIQFTIEPSCTFEEIPFSIQYKDGEFIFADPKC